MHVNTVLSEIQTGLIIIFRNRNISTLLEFLTRDYFIHRSGTICFPLKYSLFWRLTENLQFIS